MILPFLAAATTVATMPGSEVQRFTNCVALTRSDPVRAATEAEAWAGSAKTIPAYHCLGLAYSAAQRWTSAATVFEKTAAEAELAKDNRAASLWVQGGNAALAADDPGRARGDLDHAIPLPMASQARGEAYLDRARADVGLKDLAAARVDLDNAVKLTPQDSFAWLLSATLARRQKDYDRAEADIGQAIQLAPDDAAVALEAGNIAAAKGVIAAARIAWEKAVELAPKDPAGQAAAAALSANRD